MVGAKVKTRPLLCSPCSFPEADGKNSGLWREPWAGVRELVGSGADPLMTSGSELPLLPPCPETLSWGWGRPPSGRLGGSSETGAMTASLGRLAPFPPVEVNVPRRGLVPGHQEMRIWAAHFVTGSWVWRLISTHLEPVLPVAQGDRLPAVRACASEFSADAPVLSTAPLQLLGCGQERSEINCCL